MLYILFTYYIFFILLFICSNVGNVTANTQHQQMFNSSIVPNSTSSGTNEKIKANQVGNNNQTIIALNSEGMIVTDKPQNTLLSPRNSLLSLDNEFAKNKQKSITARKGADPMLLYNNIDSSTEMKESHSTNTTKATFVNSTKDIKGDEILTSKVNLTSHSENKNKSASETHVKSSENDTHKPYYLSSEALSKIDTQNNKNPSGQVTSSDKSSTIKIYQVPTHRSPGLIMPFIITILVVPLFAVLGYLALKRGKEAWKNRHYKRMDFLLDGMYND